ncbi:MAG: hypothetical protein OEM97_08330, partial [Acidimicrobiia bacterium]|nr:hypothetical protein [Acidimicrobiia bacterium]
MRGLTELRVIEFGLVPALRSQTLWHAIAYGVSEGQPATLSFMQPRRPYVSIGFHRHIDEVDREWCTEHALPVFRRMVGGGPVYLDDAQLFFQLTLPVSMVPALRAQAVRTMLAPAVDAFRAVGVDARLDRDSEVVVGDRKICGHGAGQIGDAVIVVGNVITSFDHRSASRVLAAPDRDAHSELERMMQMYVLPTPIPLDTFSEAAVNAYSHAFDAAAFEGALSRMERDHLARLDALFTTEEWVSDSPPRRPTPWTVKIKSAVWVASETDASTRVTISAVGDHIVRARVDDDRLNGHAERIAEGLVGSPVRSLRARARNLGA